jgi:4-hydroxy-3-methylbut-2-enyl diphosphate reductase
MTAMASTMTKQLFLAEPLGFCGGVRRAVQTFEDMLKKYPREPIYVLHELVHNSVVTESMIAKGAEFVKKVEDIPVGAVALFGAHGVTTATEEAAKRRNLRLSNAVCPLVVQLQEKAARFDPDIPLVFFGDKQHPEVQSILDHAAAHDIHVISSMEEIDSLPPMQRAVFLSQTTRNAEVVAAIAKRLGERIPQFDNQAHVCPTVQKHQVAVRRLAQTCDAMLIIGSQHSANGRYLAELAGISTGHAHLIENAQQLKPEDFENIQTLGLGTATSTPDSVIKDVIDWLHEHGFKTMPT